jgi:hypothetical protein
MAASLMEATKGGVFKLPVVVHEADQDGGDDAVDLTRGRQDKATSDGAFVIEDEEDDEELQRALALSLSDSESLLRDSARDLAVRGQESAGGRSTRPSSTTADANVTDVHIDDEDEELRRAIELSMAAFDEEVEPAPTSRPATVSPAAATAVASSAVIEVEDDEDVEFAKAVELSLSSATASSKPPATRSPPPDFTFSDATSQPSSSRGSNLIMSSHEDLPAQASPRSPSAESLQNGDATPQKFDAKGKALVKMQRSSGADSQGGPDGSDSTLSAAILALADMPDSSIQGLILAVGMTEAALRTETLNQRRQLADENLNGNDEARLRKYISWLDLLLSGDGSIRSSLETALTNEMSGRALKSQAPTSSPSAEEQNLGSNARASPINPFSRRGKRTAAQSFGDAESTRNVVKSVRFAEPSESFALPSDSGSGQAKNPNARSVVPSSGTPVSPMDEIEILSDSADIAGDSMAVDSASPATDAPRSDPISDSDQQTGADVYDPTERTDVDADLAEESNIFADFLSSVSDRPVDQVRAELEADADQLRSQRAKGERDSSQIEMDMIIECQVSLLE